MARINIVRQQKTDRGWNIAALPRDGKGRIKWPSGQCRYLIEWRENGKRKRLAAGITPAEVLEAQRRKRVELDARKSGLKLLGIADEEGKLPLRETIANFLKDIQAFRKPLTYQKYEHILELFAEHVAPKSDAHEVTPEDVKRFLAWRKSKGYDPGTTLYTDRVMLHNFFSKLKIDNPVNEVPRFAKFRKKPVAFTDEELKKFFGVCTPWERAFFGVVRATGLRRGELQTLHWSDLDLSRKRVHVTAKPDYGFIPKDWEERTVALTDEVAKLLRKHPRLENCPLVFPAPTGKPNWRFIHDRVKIVAKRAGLNPKDWYLHRFRDTAATRWLRAGIDVRTVQTWLGHESLDTTQKYLEPSKATEEQLEKLKIPV